MLHLGVNLQYPSGFPPVPPRLFLLENPKQILPMTPTKLPLVAPMHRLNCLNHSILQIPPQFLFQLLQQPPLRQPLQIPLNYFLLWLYWNLQNSESHAHCIHWLNQTSPLEYTQTFQVNLLLSIHQTWECLYNHKRGPKLLCCSQDQVHGCKFHLFGTERRILLLQMGFRQLLQRKNLEEALDIKFHLKCHNRRNRHMLPDWIWRIVRLSLLLFLLLFHFVFRTVLHHERASLQELVFLRNH